MNYTYDPNGRQLTASRTDNTGGITSVYDCAGQRVQTSSGTVVRQMVYDIFGQLVEDYRADPTPSTYQPPQMTGVERENIYRGGQLLAVQESNVCYKTISDFVDTFFSALGISGTTTEKDTWKLTLGQSQARGVGALIGAAQNLGNSLMTDSRYSNPPVNHAGNLQYVKDLYAGYLQRNADADPSGRDFWTGVLDGGTSRANVRLAFAVSSEFSEKMAKLCAGTSSSASLRYVLSDVQGSARVLMENNGTSSAILSRHDYLPFGDEIWAGVGSRTASQKYSITDKVRQKFALTERDEASGLDHTWFRKYESYAGRWTSPDPLVGFISDPQSFNAYAYSQNDSVNQVDPTGLRPCAPGERGAQCGWESVSAGFWGWGDQNNRRKPRDWALEDKPQALMCPVGQVCFWESLDDKRYRLVIFQPSDFKGKWDNGPTQRNWERMLRNWRAQKLPGCLRDAEDDYQKANDKLMDEASSWGTDLSVYRLLTILGSQHWDVQKVKGKLALRTAVYAAVKSQAVYQAAMGTAALGNLFGTMLANAQARARAIGACKSLYGPRATDPKD